MTFAPKPPGSTGPDEDMRLMSAEEVKARLEAAGMTLHSLGEPPSAGQQARRLVRDLAAGLSGPRLRGLLKVFAVLGVGVLVLLGILRLLPPGGILRSAVRMLLHAIGLYLAVFTAYLLSVLLLYLPVLAGVRILLGSKVLRGLVALGRVLLLLLLVASPVLFFVRLPWYTGALVVELYTFATTLGALFAGLLSLRFAREW